MTAYPSKADLIRPVDFRPGMTQVGHSGRYPKRSLGIVRGLVYANAHSRNHRLGEVIKREGGVGPDIVSPLFTSRLKQDPVAQELVRLGVAPPRLKRQIGGVELNAKQYDEYQLTAGRHLRQSLKEIVGHPAWQAIPAGIQVTLIEKAISLTRSPARKHMQMRYPSLIQKSVQQKMERLQ